MVIQNPPFPSLKFLGIDPVLVPVLIIIVFIDVVSSLRANYLWFIV